MVEGWAVYAESVLAVAGDPALRMQQLKMQLRSTINAILDVRVQARGMTEAEADCWALIARASGSTKARLRSLPPVRLEIRAVT